MSLRLADIQARQAAVKQLDSLIAAMRGMAATRAEQSRHKLPAIRDYAAAIGRAIGQALSLQEPPAQAPVLRPKAASILFGSEQGFVGTLNERLWLAEEASPTGFPGGRLVIGRRMAELGLERGHELPERLPMATHPDSVAALALQISEWLYRRVTEARLTHARIIYAVAKPGEPTVIEQRHLLPFNYARFPQAARRHPVQHYIVAPQLIEAVAAEYVFAEICEAAMLALAAENEARLASMASAKRNIEETAERLAGQERQMRQAAITEELVELTSAAEVFTKISSL